MRQPAGPVVSALIAEAGDQAARRFFEFFTANIPNDNTRAAYALAVAQFLRWAEGRGLTLRTIEPVAVAAYVKESRARLADESVKPPVNRTRFRLASYVAS